MKIVKSIILYFLLLIVMIICGTAVLKIYDWILGLDFDNIWTAGFKVGFIAWGLMLIYGYYRHIRNRKS